MYGTTAHPSLLMMLSHLDYELREAQGLAAELSDGGKDYEAVTEWVAEIVVAKLALNMQLKWELQPRVIYACASLSRGLLLVGARQLTLDRQQNWSKAGDNSFR